MQYTSLAQFASHLSGEVQPASSSGLHIDLHNLLSTHCHSCRVLQREQLLPTSLPSGTRVRVCVLLFLLRTHIYLSVQANTSSWQTVYKCKFTTQEWRTDTQGLSSRFIYKCLELLHRIAAARKRKQNSNKTSIKQIANYWTADPNIRRQVSTNQDSKYNDVYRQHCKLNTAYAGSCTRVFFSTNFLVTLSKAA